MKSFCWITVLFFGFHLKTFVRGGSTVQKEVYANYLDNVVKQFAHHFEAVGFTGNALPMLDSKSKITNIECKCNIEGEVDFYDGFVVNIKEVSGIDRNAFMNPTVTEHNVTMNAFIYLKNVYVVYDVSLSFGDFKDTGTIEFDFMQIKLQMQVFMDFKTKNIKGTVKYSSYTSTNDIGVRAFPYHYHMQMVARSKAHYLSNADSEKNIIKSFKEWKLNKYMQKAVEEVVFPEICYFCD